MAAMNLCADVKQNRHRSDIARAPGRSQCRRPCTPRGTASRMPRLPGGGAAGALIVERSRADTNPAVTSARNAAAWCGRKNPLNWCGSIAVQHDRHELLKCPGRGRLGSIKTKDDIEAVARPFAGDALRLRDKRVGDDNNVLMLPANEHDAVHPREHCSQDRLPVPSQNAGRRRSQALRQAGLSSPADGGSCCRHGRPRFRPCLPGRMQRWPPASAIRAADRETGRRVRLKSLPSASPAASANSCRARQRHRPRRLRRAPACRRVV